MITVRRIERQDGSVIYRVQVSEPSERRLDRFLAEELELSRSRAAWLIEAGHVRVNGEPSKKSYVPEAGDRIEVELPPPEPAAAEPEDIPLEIVYEDEALLVVDKRAGMVVHPAPGHRRGTLMNALLHHLGRPPAAGDPARAGIVHRLDKDTSGLIVVAKDERAHRRLSEALARRRIERRYLAACWGHLPQDRLRIDADLGRHPRDRKRMAVRPGGRRAVTEVERLERWRAAELLRVRLETGRTHQIRVHLRHIGHPVVGDREYAAGWERGLAAEGGSWVGELARRVGRQFLHAAELRFEHPLTGRLVEIEAPLPPDLAAAAEWARETS